MPISISPLVAIWCRSSAIVSSGRSRNCSSSSAHQLARPGSTYLRMMMSMTGSLSGLTFFRSSFSFGRGGGGGSGRITSDLLSQRMDGLLDEFRDGETRGFGLGDGVMNRGLRIGEKLIATGGRFVGIAHAKSPNGIGATRWPTRRQVMSPD